jgi:hypothetical protein
MNKTLNIFAILLIIAFVNSNKMISYSDIVSSLVELSIDDNGITNINTIVENFQNSNSLLTNLKTSVTENCRKLVKNNDAHTFSLKEKVISYQKSVEKLSNENKEITSQIQNDEGSVKSEVEKVRIAKADIQEAQKDALNKEKDILETVNVLKRLKYIAIDELQGIQQKTTEMHKFNVTIQASASFLQLPSFQQDLKGLLSKADSVNKGLISTLILLAQSAGKQTFANPETVKKIVAMIEKIIENSLTKMQGNIKAKDEKVKSYNEIVENSRNLITRLKEEIQRKVHTKASNEKEVVFYNNDIIFFNKALNRRFKRNTFNVGLCKEQTELVDKHYTRYVESLDKVNELRTQLASQ